MAVDAYIIIATFIVSIVGTICAVWRLEYAKKQYDIAVQTLKESRNYWNTRLDRDKKRGKST